MQERKLSTGETVYICRKEDPKPALGVWFTAEEWAWMQKLGQAKHDPEERKDFFMGVVERKRENPGWCLFEQFPEGLAEETVPSPTSHSAAANNAPTDNSKRRAFVGESICREVIDQLRGRGARTRGDRQGESA